MKKNKDYYFTENALINEGILTASITKASMFFTKEYIYIIPEHTQKISGYQEFERTDYINSVEFIENIQSRIDTMSIQEFHQEMQEYLPEHLINILPLLAKFSVSTGWLTAGIKIKKKGEHLRVINIRPRKQLEQIKEFYKFN